MLLATYHANYAVIIGGSLSKTLDNYSQLVVNCMQVAALFSRYNTVWSQISEGAKFRD